MAMRKPFYVRFVEGEDEGKGGQGGGSEKTYTEAGYPKDTPVAEMTDKEQAAYWKFHSRKHETLANSRSDYDQQKADAEKWRQAQREQMTPDQKAIDQAREDARREERGKIAPRLVAAEFKAKAKNVNEELLEAFLEDLDYTKYLTASGDVDTDKVKTRVEKLAPKQQQQQRQNHQGYRPAAGATSVTAGRDLFANRNKKS